MAGLSGSGKSTVAQALAEQTRAIRLRSDAVRKHLAGVPLREQGSEAIYTPAMSDKTYARLIELGVQLASDGYRVILDAKFDRQTKRQAAIAAAASQNLAFTFLHCTAPAEVLQARVRTRSGDITDATTAILAQQSMEPFGAAEPVKTLDTTQSEAEICQQLGGLFGQS